MSASRATNGAANRSLGGGTAIVGMACLFPAAPDLGTYWHNIVSRVDAVTDPPDSWWTERFYDPDSGANDRVYCRRGGYLGALAEFDPLDHGVLPVAAEGGEPDQWLALKVAREAFADAGYGDEVPERHRTAVILGKGNYLNRGNFSVLQHGLVAHQTIDIIRALRPDLTAADLERIREELKRQLPRFQPDTVAGLIPNVTAGRIANRLDLMGPSYTLDAACASSLVALDLAVRDLAARRCDLALVGGVHVTAPAAIGPVFCQLGALSGRQEIRPFDARADGTILGEGVGMVVLKRLDDARRDGHRIYAVVRGVGVASDGRGAGVTAPRTEGAVLALERAYEQTGLAPATVGLIEAHGTGTPVGDANEIRALRNVFGPRTGPLPRCALGSVKSMLGHLMPAAGMAGLIKAALALYHRVLPPTLHVEEPNPAFELHRTPFYLNTEARPWMQAGADARRRAGVNAFGFGGINAHAILEECPAGAAETPSGSLTWDSEACILSAASRTELAERARQLASRLEAGPLPALKDLAYSLNVPLDPAPHRLALVASSVADLAAKLVAAAEQLADPRRRKIHNPQGIYFTEEPLARGGRLAFLFPGEGSQYANMAADLCMEFPEVRRAFERADRVWAGHGREHLPSDILFPRPTPGEAEGQDVTERLWQMDAATALVLAADDAFLALLRRLDLRPDAVVGHSTGEFAALLASGMIELAGEEESDRFAREMYQTYEGLFASESLSPAALVAVGAEPEAVSAALDPLDGGVYVAMDNCPQQSVIVGAERAVQPAVDRLRGRGLLCERLPFDRPYHTPLFQDYAAPLRDFFARWLTSPPQVPTYTCATAAPFPEDLDHIRTLAVEQWMSRVEFRKTVQAMYADGVRVFVEVGPRGNLSAFVDAILRGRPHLAAPANVPHRSGISQLNHLVAMLAAHGVDMKLDYLYAHRSPRQVGWDGAAAPRDPGRPPGHALRLATDWPRMSLSEETAARLQPAPPPASEAVPASTHSVCAPEPPAPVPATDPSAQPLALPQALIAAPGSVPPSAARVLAAHLHAVELLLTAQHDVMQAFLAGQVLDSPSGRQPPEAARSKGAGADTRTAPPDERREPAGMAPAPPAVATPPPGGAAPAQPTESEPLGDVLLRLVSERTGYPIEMLHADLDLEADLGIDSIKRVEILGSFQEQAGSPQGVDMEALAGRRTLREIIDVLTASVATASSPAAIPPPAPVTPQMPLLGTIVSLAPGEKVEAVRELTVDDDLFLRHHTFGRQVSVTDPELIGLPVVPFTVVMELMAEAAALLAPGQRLVGMRDIRGYRWLALDEGRLRLAVVAQRRPSASEIDVKVYESGAPEAGQNPAAMPVFEGRVLLDTEYPQSPRADLSRLANERPAGCPPERLYEDMTFHGPAMRGVVSLDGVSDEGARATLKVLPAGGLIRSRPDPAFLLDPILLDQLGQVVGFWAMDQLGPEYAYFPFRVEELRLYGPPLAAGEVLRCQARAVRVGDGVVRADIEAVRSDGHVCVRLRGWEDRRFAMPRAVMRLSLAPGETVLGEPVPQGAGPFLEAAGSHTYRLGLEAFPRGFFADHGAIWLRALAHTVLGRSERDVWRNLRLPASGRVEWLLGRIAAKDAVRACLRQHHGLSLCPADVEIYEDEYGRFVARGPWTRDLPPAPLVCLAHAGGRAVAVAVPGSAGAGVGVHLERIDCAGEDAERTALTRQERDLLAALRQAGTEYWPLRVWCAKQAAARALGQGLAEGPQALIALKVDEGEGIVCLGLAGRGAAPTPVLTAFTLREGDWIVATCLYRSEEEPNREAQP
jgi:acyl transferase domain-containing protein